MLGATQKAWFKNELLAAKDGALTVWLNSQVWCVDTPFGGLDTDGDHWGTFATERAEISDYLADNGITNVIQLTGDMHALGINTAIDYSAAQTAPMRIYAGSSLDSIPVARGHWEYVQTGRGQYGTLTITDNGQRLTVLWQGWAVDDTTGVETLVMSDTFSRKVPVTGQGYPVKVWDGGAWVERPVKRSTGTDWISPPVKSP
jgi:alkaline phosphatase D